MMGAYSRQIRKKIYQEAQGKKGLAGGYHMYPPRHLVVNGAARNIVLNHKKHVCVIDWSHKKPSKGKKTPNPKRPSFGRMACLSV